MRVAFLATLLGLLCLTEVYGRYTIEDYHRYVRTSKNGFQPPFSHISQVHVHRVEHEKEDGVHIRTKRATVNFAPTCPAGYTGAYCESPVCSNAQSITQHDGEVNPEVIFNGASQQCSETFIISFDIYMEQTTISLTGSMLPNATLYSPNGTLINGVITQSDSSQSTVYNNLMLNYGPGQYTIMVSSQNNDKCYVSVFAASKMVIDGGFVSNITDDQVQLRQMVDKGVERNPVENVLSYFAFRPFNLDPPGQTVYVTFYRGDQQLYPPIPVRNRYVCNAYAYAGPSVCPTHLGLYHVWVSGVDKTGNLWNRFYLYGCDEAGAPTMTPLPAPTQPNPTTCMNGGTITNTSGTTKCYCGQFYEGVQCEIKRCFHDGYLNDNGDCVCIPGYTGHFCERVVCKNPYQGNFETQRVSIAFVIRGTTSMIPYMDNAYRNAIRTASFLVNSYPGYIQSFVLVFFANGRILHSSEYTEFDVFQAAFGELKSPLTLVNATGCNDNVLGAISQAMSQPIFGQYRRSPIFVWSDALPNDPLSVQYNLYAQIGYFRGRVFSMIPTGGNDTCVVDTHDPTYQDFRRLAAYSQGLVIRGPSQDLEDAHTAITPTLRNAVHLATNDLIEQCSYAPAYQTFFVDETVGDFFVFATGTSLVITVKGPHGLVHPDSHNQYGSLVVQKYSYMNTIKGNYILTVRSTASPTASGPCAYRVIGDANSQAFLATAGSLTTDLNVPTGFNPILNQPNYIVARFNNFLNRRLNTSDTFTVSSLMAELTIWSNEYGSNKNRTMVYASNGRYRDSCDYHFFFPEWSCPQANMLFYAQLYVEDGTGYTMSRVVTGFCVTTQLNVTGPCLNGGILNPTDNVTCLCPPGFNGTDCGHIICQNGGTPNVYDCICPPDWAGTFCELASCITRDFDTPFTPNGKSLALLVHNSLATRPMIANMNSTISKAVEEIIFQHPVWLNNYKMVSFDDKSIAAAADTSDPNLFIQGFNTIYQHNQNNQDYSCDNLWVAEAIYSVMRSPTTTRYGVVFVYLSGLPNLNDTVLYELNEALQLSKLQINFIQANSMPCGASLSDPKMQVLFNIASVSGGTVYLANPDYAGRTLLSMPTTYAKSYLYQNFVSDCSKNYTYFYVPIDAETQTFQVQIFGDLDGDVTYMSPDGQMGTNQNWYLRPIYNDVGSNARFDEITKPCDQGWRYFDKQCWYLDITPMSWNDALEKCISMNSILPTIYSAQEESDYLHFQAGNVTVWTGLNDQAQLGKWVWAQTAGNTLALSNTGYTNWGSGYPNNTDPLHRCVTTQKYNGWQQQNCSQPMLYFCVKNAYDYTNVFGGENANFLQPGMWTIEVKTYSDPDYPAPAPCEVKVTSQSGIRAFLGYSFNQHNDLDSVEPVQDSAGNYFVSHIESLSKNTNPGRLQYAHFYVTDNMQMAGVQQFKRRDRDSCIWEYISTPFQCPTQNTSFTAFHPFLNVNQTGFQTALTGIDFAGNLFQRIRPTVCYIKNPLRDCDNGGVYDKTRMKCICPPDWSGDRCEFPICYNKGTPDEVFQDCACPSYIKPPNPDVQLFNGTHCEYPICIKGTNNGLPLPISTNKTFVLVLDGSKGPLMTNVLNNLSTILYNVTNYAQPISTFANYIAVIVRDASYQGQEHVTPPIIDTDLNSWINKIVNEVTTNAYTSSLPNRLLFSGLHRIGVDKNSLKILAPQSQAFVLTGALASDGGVAHTVMDEFAPYQLAISFMFMGDTRVPGNNPKDPNLQMMYETTFVTNGGFYQTHDTANLDTFWIVVLAQRLNSYFIQNSINKNCNNHQEYFQVGTTSSKVLIDIYTEAAPHIEIYSNNRSAINAKIVGRTNTNYIFSTDVGANSGVWNVVINRNDTAAGFCAIKVKGIDNTYPVAWAFTQDTEEHGIHTNDAQYNPVGGVNNAIVANVPQGSAAFAQIYDVFGKTLLWSSPMIKRSGCTYNYITRDTFKCPAERLFVVIESYDQALHPYRRTDIVSCLNYH